MFARPAAPDPRPRAIANWLMLVAAMVFAMVVVGGITRLTELGLSITRWEPISGAIPPFGAEAWRAQFDLYKASPQFATQGHGMTLADFKFIFFWEYLHRLLGRLIGLAFALPLAWFWWKRAIPAGFGWKLGAILALGALQGAIGWWMVASGLVDRPEVSHIRLAIHLITALLIFASMIWVALDLKARARPPLLAIWGLCALFLQFMFGAYVAGLDAGYAFNTWPKMGEDWYPAGAEWMAPALRNFADNPVTVQFVHRWLAFVVAGLAIAVGVKAWLRGLRMEAAALIGAVTAQITLGILTIISGVQIDIAVTHQGMAVLLLAAFVTAAHRLGRGAGVKGAIVSVYAVFADEQEAHRIGGAVVEERLAACVNVFGPCHSIYRWQGKVEAAAEVAAIFKARADKADALIARIAELHSYDVPAIAVWPIDRAFPAYAEWVNEEG